MKHIVIVGGGSAGWLTAGILASKYLLAGSDPDAELGIQITLIESPDVPTVGVGEGTWPSMRTTLKDMGISETEFIRACDVSLKQGTRFEGWHTRSADHYYHPFSLPEGYHQTNLADWVAELMPDQTFENAVCAQALVCERGLSAKSITTPEYAFNLNYGYHLDAGKFAQFLRQHCTSKLGVDYVQDHVLSVNEDADGSIKSLLIEKGGQLAGDLFIDCTGFSAKLIHEHYQVPYKSLVGVLNNDSALAVQVPYREGQEIASATHSTAQESGWVWDIGLSSRRGIGYVYASEHSTDEQAYDVLNRYVSKNCGDALAKSIEPRRLSFSPKYLEKFWYKNCVAIGLSAGFVEPLEASALVLIETSAKAIVDLLPMGSKSLESAANRFNQKMDYHWLQIVDFLKLHYVLSERDEPYWRESRNPDSIPDSLTDYLNVWKYRSPWHQDAPRIDELFSSASFQFVLYGMGGQPSHTRHHFRSASSERQKAIGHLHDNRKRVEHWIKTLPTNRQFIEKVGMHGLQKI
ncbi:tryptophan 7-halogenase [Arenicella sp. 4NH20-0111]|uniref:tryptophan halogenase family protein n=1 Tax=Arenicella sp. 4NH20-0111 TaxID=3127648 RepID=UPI00310759E0